jgi:hypothetical protein
MERGLLEYATLLISVLCSLYLTLKTEFKQIISYSVSILHCHIITKHTTIAMDQLQLLLHLLYNYPCIISSEGYSLLSSLVEVH